MIMEPPANDYATSCSIRPDAEFQIPLPKLLLRPSQQLCRTTCRCPGNETKHVENSDVPTLKKGGSAKKHDEDEDFI